MTKQEKNQVKDLMEAWVKEAEQIKEDSKQTKDIAILDNGNSGKYTELTKKYQKLIEKRLNHKVWKK